MGGGGAVLERGAEDARLVRVKIEKTETLGACHKGVAFYVAVDIRISGRVVQHIANRLRCPRCLLSAITENFQ